MKICGVVGGNGNDWSLPAGGKLADEPSGGKPINQWQTQIHQNQLGLLCLRRPDRFFTIPRFLCPAHLVFETPEAAQVIDFTVRLEYAEVFCYHGAPKRDTRTRLFRVQLVHLSSG